LRIPEKIFRNRLAAGKCHQFNAGNHGSEESLRKSFSIGSWEKNVTDFVVPVAAVKLVELWLLVSRPAKSVDLRLFEKVPLSIFGLHCRMNLVFFLPDLISEGTGVRFS